MSGTLRLARTGYALATLCLATGIVQAARSYPGGFDWAYTVMSSLASLKYNPAGARWFSLALAVSMLLLWPLAGALQEPGLRSRLARFSVAALRVGLAFGLLMGLERAFLFHASSLLHKSHEVLALLCFVGLYAGAISQCLLRRDLVGADRRWQPTLLLGLLFAVGLAQLALYLTQRDLGWIGREWRVLGISPWHSFALWQWLAGAVLLLAFGWFASGPARTIRPP